jgi:branched-chain amino acid transport system ATP-binding protein
MADGDTAPVRPTAGDGAADKAAGDAARDGGSRSSAALRLNNIEVIYDEVILVLRGLSLEVAPGSVVALLGPNGAGKSTTLKAVSGLLPSEHGEITQGDIHLDDTDITHLDAAKRVRQGMSLCMEGRHVFEHLTVHENLVAGGYTRGGARGEDLELVYGYFPQLGRLRSRVAGYLSGGEQQQLAIGRALMSRPRLLMLDEPSLGLAPRLVEEIFAYIARLNRELGTTVLLVEQNARLALDIADHGYVMERGRIVLEGSGAELRENPDVKEFYLGVGKEGARRSYREVKHYKRRKRWL